MYIVYKNSKVHCIKLYQIVTFASEDVLQLFIHVVLWGVSYSCTIYMLHHNSKYSLFFVPLYAALCHCVGYCRLWIGLYLIVLLNSNSKYFMLNTWEVLLLKLNKSFRFFCFVFGFIRSWFYIVWLLRKPNHL